MEKNIDSIEQIISICGNDFTWPNMASNILKVVYEMLKELQKNMKCSCQCHLPEYMTTCMGICCSNKVTNQNDKLENREN